MKTKLYEIQTPRSNVDWVGRKVTGAHHGTIAIKEGSFKVKDGQLISGKVVIDVTSIKILDITDPTTNAQLAGHLASCDFFDSEHYPAAEIEIHSVSGSQIYGNLTIKGNTHPLNFEAQINCDDATLTASGKIIIDRTDYGMKLRSGNFFKNLGDTLIYNQFDLNVNIIAQAVAG